MINKVIFDLDGTLINSRKGITKSLKFALKKENLNFDIQEVNIGPPLRVLLEELGIEELAIENVLKSFIEHYDDYGYRETELYSSAIETLEYLFQKNLEMYILTNKRMSPTIKILQALGINKYFTDVYCLDYYPQFNHKKDLLKHLISSKKIKSSNMVLVGDSIDDYNAAELNQIPFIYAQYGYGKDQDVYEYIITELNEILKNFKTI